MRKEENILNDLWMIGITHNRTPLNLQEKLSLTEQQIIDLIQAAKQREVNSILPLSTCNRVEIYARVEKPEILIDLLFEVAQEKIDGTQLTELRKLIVVKNAYEAITHLFQVTTGLDSQIIGDAQITGQVRRFLKMSLKYNSIDAVLNRLVETAINVGKKVKSHPVDSYSYSMADAAVKLALTTNSKSGKYLVIGTGKMGVLTIKRLLKFVVAKNITILNRTNTKALHLSDKYGISTADYDNIRTEISKADFIFTATSSPSPIITRDLLNGINLNAKTFIDLSLPRNVEADVPAEIIDISMLADTDKEKKDAYIKLANQLIEKGITEYSEWLTRFELAQTIKTELQDSIFQNSLDDNVLNPQSKFVDGITRKYFSDFQKVKQSRNLAA